MNKKILSTFVLFSLVLTACTSTAKTTDTASNSRASSAKLPMRTKLVVGTVKLEETEYKLTPEQATQLLPMFYVLQELNDGDSAAQEEIDGLVSQIQETLTKDQLQAIDDMSLSMLDVLVPAPGGSKKTPNAASPSGIQGSAAGGPPDMGGMPGGGPSELSGGSTSPTGTTSANNSTKTPLIMDTSTPSALFDTAIEFLKKKTQ